MTYRPPYSNHPQQHAVDLDKRSDTPRSDYARVARDLVRGAPVDYVAHTFAQELERENAALAALGRFYAVQCNDPSAERRLEVWLRANGYCFLVREPMTPEQSLRVPSDG